MRILTFEERIEELEANVEGVIAILRSDIVESIAASLDDIRALTAILPGHMPHLAEALRPVHDINESARSALRRSEVFERSDLDVDDE